MSSIINVFYQIAKSFVYGFSDFWTWFTSPLFEAGDWAIYPWQILTFGGIVLVFGLVLVHLINPVG